MQYSLPANLACAVFTRSCAFANTQCQTSPPQFDIYMQTEIKYTFSHFYTAASNKHNTIQTQRLAGNVQNKKIWQLSACGHK